MYQKILAEAIQELKETSFKEAFAEEESKHFVRDCQIETDFEILIPDDYVSHIGERLTLYRELDELDKDEDLDRFQLRLEDRFGPIPESTKALFKTLKLRWLAKGLGMEKVVLKNGAMINYFNSNPEAQFYQSATFQQILRYVQQNPGTCRMTEKNEKLSLRFSHISDVDQAYETLEGILSKTLVN